MTSLTRRNLEMLEWIRAFLTQNQYSPSYREIQRGFGYKSISAVQNQLRKLKEAGLITISADKARTIRLVEPEAREWVEPELSGIPIYGAIAAGGFVEVFADDAIERLPSSLFPQRSFGLERFALRVRGNSMVGAHILDRDIVILDKPTRRSEVKNRSIVAARIDGENQTTLKRWHQERNQVYLVPENPDYPTIQIEAHKVLVEGIYVGLIRGIQ